MYFKASFQCLIFSIPP